MCAANPPEETHAPKHILQQHLQQPSFMEATENAHRQMNGQRTDMHRIKYNSAMKKHTKMMLFAVNSMHLYIILVRSNSETDILRYYL